MTRPIAICPDCRFLFASEEFWIAGGAVLLLGNNVDCPRCGSSRAFVPDGMYYFGDAARKIACSLSQQPGALEKAASLAEAAAIGIIPPQSAIAAAESISFATGNLFRRVYSTLKHSLEIVAALATIGATFIAYSQSQSADEAQRQTNEILSRIVAVQENQHRNADENVTRPRPRPVAKSNSSIGNSPPKPRPNRQSRRKAKKGPK